VGKPQIKKRRGKIILKIHIYFKMRWNGVELSNMTHDRNKRRTILNNSEQLNNEPSSFVKFVVLIV
jgi:hypothetical protein